MSAVPPQTVGAARNPIEEARTNVYHVSLIVIATIIISISSSS